MQSIGTTWCATAGIHHWAVVYLSIFWEFLMEMLWDQQLVVDMFLGINQIDLMIDFPYRQKF